jgi:hypothetical protein
MSENVEELFGEGAGAPTPRTILVWVLLILGLATTFLGMVCTAAPGGVLVLLAWYVVEKEVDRIDSGYLPATARGPVRRARISTLIGVLVVIALLILQSVFVGFNLYESLWTRILQWWVGAPPV